MNSTDHCPVIFLMGPTAAGKTDLAIRLCNDLPCRIVSVDSAMVYKGMNIGTAKPDAQTLRIAPHRLIDICDPLHAYSAAQFRIDALREIKEIIAQGYWPLLVGGTFLYFRALEYGLSPLPAADPRIRSQIEAQAGREGWQAMHSRLQIIDPSSAQKIHPNDPQRIQRALEVYELTGQAMSKILQYTDTPRFPYTPIKIVVAPAQRETLHERIEIRFKHMLDTGLVTEVESLYHRGDLNKDLPAMRAVGYRQVWEYIQGRLDFDEMQYKGIVSTRQFAKRQYTWLRSEQNTVWYDSLDSQIYKKVLNCVRSGPIS